MSIFALVISRGCTNLAFPNICAKAVAAQGNGSVEVLLPKGGGQGRQLSGSGWSAVLRVDADNLPDGPVARLAASETYNTALEQHLRRLAPFGVIRGEAGVSLIGRVQGSDLPGQIVITRPGGQLVETHRHIHPKGVRAARAVRPARATSGGASGVSDLRSSIASLADENWGCRPVTSTHTGAGEPVEVYGAGASGVTGLLLRARGSVSWQGSLRTGAVRRWPPREGNGGMRWRSCSTGSPGWMSARTR
jgi:hypothetical protein